MTSYEVELQSAIGFLQDQVEDLRLLFDSTPPEILSATTGQQLMQQALDALSSGLGMVLARKLLAIHNGGNT